MTCYDAYLTAVALTEHGRHDTDAVTRADIDAAADYVGARRPDGPHDRHAVRTALDALTA